MTEYDEFVAIFSRSGIEFLRHTNMFPDRHGDEPQSSVYVLSVSQAHFCFDKDQKYIGVVGDETGHFEPRRL